jgi:hypothetical protein
LSYILHNYKTMAFSECDIPYGRDLAMLNHQTPIDTYVPEIWAQKFYWESQGGNPEVADDMTMQLARDFGATLDRLVELNFRPRDWWPPNRFVAERLRRQAFGVLAASMVASRLLESVGDDGHGAGLAYFFIDRDEPAPNELPTSQKVHMTLADSESFMRTGTDREGWYRDGNFFVHRAPSPLYSRFAIQLREVMEADALPPLVQLEPYVATRGLIPLQYTPDLGTQGR